MRIVYLGTPEFAVKPLTALKEAGFDVVAAVTARDKKVGRKQILTAPPVKRAAENMGIKVLQYDRISKEGAEDLRALSPDIMVTCAFGQILSREILDIAPKGVINVHGSLLPKYRGASPIQSAIINGDKETGITIMKTALKVDSGAVILQEKVKIGRETSKEMFEKLSGAAGPLLVKALRLIESGKAEYIEQKEDEATYSGMLKKEESFIDWTVSSIETDCFIRGLNDWPVARTTHRGKILKIYYAEPVEEKGKPGEVLSAGAKEGVIVACGSGALMLKSVQAEGERIMTAEEFAAGRKITKGEVFL